MITCLPDSSDSEVEVYCSLVDICTESDKYEYHMRLTNEYLITVHY